MCLFAHAAFLLLALAAGPAHALEPEQREVVVVSGRVWEGYEYKEFFVPSTKPDLTVIAGEDSAIVFVRTLEYYWPLSRQVYVDFERQRDILKGELVIRRNGEVVAREALRPYSMFYPEGAINGHGRLLWGEEAERAYAEYQESERRFAREFALTQRAHAAYERRLLESGAARESGEAVEAIPPPPPLPEPSLRLVTAPVSGFRINLEPGDYAIVLERDGEPVAGTERRLRAVGLSGRAALVADVVPTERWTRPLAANTETARIFARPGTVFYMTLTEASHFDEAEYLPVVSPQAEPVPGRPMWVRRRPSGVDQLQVAWENGSSSTLSRRPLKVEQTRGSSFGYRVRAAREGEEPDLDAFTVDVPADPAVTHGSIVIGDPSSMPFAREVIVVHPRRTTLGLCLAILPFVGYFAVLGLRRTARPGPRPPAQ